MVNPFRNSAQLSKNIAHYPGIPLNLPGYDPLLQEYSHLSVKMAQLSRNMAHLATNAAQPVKGGGYVTPFEEYYTTHE
jgi:hypothetical protein